ncbi:MAG: RNA polymerase sigma factor region1.1 domain-containing protein, partial [Patescibacteria group bacterium]
MKKKHKAKKQPKKTAKRRAVPAKKKAVIKKKTKPKKIVLARKLGKPEAEPHIDSLTKEQRLEAILKRGRGRGFVTYAEILHYFPTIEEEISLLEDLYMKFEEENIEVLETKEFLNLDEERGKATPIKKKGKKDRYSDEEMSSSDSVQMYLKEIGRIALLTP